MRRIDSPAAELFAAIERADQLDGAVTEALLRAIDHDPDTFPWPCEDVTFDPYDDSFEFKAVKDMCWKPSEEQLRRFWAMGFSRCWICYAGDVLNPQWTATDASGTYGPDDPRAAWAVKQAQKDGTHGAHQRYYKAPGAPVT